jgi:hypothetical protein
MSVSSNGRGRMARTPWCFPVKTVEGHAVLQRAQHARWNTDAARSGSSSLRIRAVVLVWLNFVQQEGHMNFKRSGNNAKSLIDVATLIIGTAAGIAVATLGPLRTSRAAIEPTATVPTMETQTSAGHNDCLGQEAVGELDLVPDLLYRSANGRERVDYHADLHLHRGENVGVSWRFDVVDDRGSVVRSAIARGTAKGSKGDSLTTSSAGADLPDGFFALRVRAAVVADGESDVLEVVQHVQVSNGLWRELSAEEWYAESAYTLALPLPPGVTVPQQWQPGVTPGGAP